MAPVPKVANRRKTAWRRACLGALTLAIAASSLPADAQSPPSEPPVAATSNADVAVRYAVKIVAPSAIEGTISASVDLVRWQDFADMTEELLDRLAREAMPQAREAAATQGYFSAQVELSHRPQGDAGGDHADGHGRGSDARDGYGYRRDRSRAARCPHRKDAIAKDPARLGIARRRTCFASPRGRRLRIAPWRAWPQAPTPPRNWSRAR